MGVGVFGDRGVVVTGAGTGIGRAIAGAFVREGARVVVVDMHSGAAGRTVDGLAAGPGHAYAVDGDVRTSGGVDQIVAAALRHVPRIEVLVNNAGVYPNSPLIHMAEEQWDTVIDTNLKGTFLMCQAVARHMVDLRIAGHIVNIASLAHKSARRGASHYCASKAGVVMFSKVIAQELAEHNIHVNVVSPGAVDVGRGIKPASMEKMVNAIPWGRLGKPEEIAEAVLLMASSGAAYVTGAVLDVDGGYGTGRFFMPYSGGATAHES